MNLSVYRKRLRQLQAHYRALVRQRQAVMANANGKIGTGGSIERDLVRRWARRRVKRAAKANSHDGVYELEHLLSWLDQQPSRTKRPGGLGKR